VAEFNRGKFKELVLYLSQRSAADEGFGMVKLNKLLYRCDFEAYRLLGRSITGEQYEKQEFGPVARHLPIALDDLAASGYVVWLRIPAGEFVRQVPDAREPADLSQFEAAELRIVEKALGDLAEFGGRKVSEWSHEQSSGWRAASIGEEIPYGSALISTEPLSEAQMARALKRSREEGWVSIRP
jgi:hypothetical protein